MDPSRPERLAYIVCAHHLPRTLAKLVAALRYQDDLVLVHFDRRAGAAQLREAQELIEGPNVVFLPSEPTPYRSFGNVRATLAGFRYLQDNRAGFSHVVLLSGQDHPIKSPWFIHRYLQFNPNLSYMQSFPLPAPGWPAGGMRRLDRAHWFVGNRVVSIPRRWLPPGAGRELPMGMLPFGGSAYWILNRRHVEFVDHLVAANPAVVDYFRRTDASDELFFQSILMNSPHAAEIVNHDLRYIDWTAPHRRPKLLDLADLPALEASPDLFARKFDYEHAPEVIDRIDQGLLDARP